MHVPDALVATPVHRQVPDSLPFDRAKLSPQGSYSMPSASDWTAEPVHGCPSPSCSSARVDPFRAAEAVKPGATLCGTRDAQSRAMSNEPPGVSNRSPVSNLFDPEREHAIGCLRKQSRTLSAANFRGMKLDPTAGAGVLPPPRWVFILDDGRALAWFGETCPYVVHPSFSELCEMHGLRGGLVHAA